MDIDKITLGKLKKFAQVFKDARERGANESDTVMYLIKMFEDVLGYDSLSGEISKEVSIKDRYCDFCIKLDGEIEYLIEAKAASHKSLREKDIEQAENYASRSGINWVLLTNGLEWQLYHLVFAEGEGINHDVVLSFNLVEEIEDNPDKIWTQMRLLTKDGIENGELEAFLSQKKVLSPASLIKALFTEKVLTAVRRELNRASDFRLDIEDVFKAVKEVITKDAIMEAGDIGFKKRKKKKKRFTKGDIDKQEDQIRTEINKSDLIKDDTMTKLDTPVDELP